MGYNERRMIAKFIKEDMLKKGFECISVNYITDPGRDSGFRYVFYLEGIRLNHQSVRVPNYIIVIPEYYSKEVTYRFGVMGVIPPEEKKYGNCEDDNINLTGSMFGYTD